jgi:hypothetical protein
VGGGTHARAPAEFFVGTIWKKLQNVIGLGSYPKRMHNLVVYSLQLFFIGEALAKMIYKDNLVTITEEKIIFEHYYFPTGKKKAVLFADIEWIKVKHSSLRNGKWRIHGTGNFKTWFPRDTQRPQRDKIFFAKIKGQWVDIGFTVEDSAQVERIFRKIDLLRQE